MISYRIHRLVASQCSDIRISTWGMSDFAKPNRINAVYSDEVIPLAECGDQRSARKEKINESCECQPCLVVACLKVENSIEEEQDKRKISFLF